MMNAKKIKRGLALGLLLLVNFFLVYRYLELDKRYNDIKKIKYHQKGYGYTSEELNNLTIEYNDVIDKSLRLEFWVLVFFFTLVAYVLYLIIKSKLSYNDKKRIAERINFKDLEENKRQEILGKIFCSKCSSYEPMDFVEEKMIIGKMYIIAKCSVCGSIAKKKNNN